MPQLPRRAIYSLLGGSDGINYGHKSFKNASMVVGDLGQVSKHLVGQAALLTVLSELSYFLQFMSITNMASAEGAEIIIFLTLPSKWAFSMVSMTPVLYNKLGTSITTFDSSGISLLKGGDGLPIEDKFSQSQP